MKQYFITFCVVLSFFATKLSGQIAIVSPNGGESVSACLSTTVTCSSTLALSTYLKVYYSVDSGKVWVQSLSNIYLNPNGQTTFQWIPPAVNSTKCLLKIADQIRTDISNATFTITKSGGPTLKILSPNKGEQWGTYSKQTIQWNGTATGQNVTLQYSSNGGSTWSSITTTANTGQYSWQVPTTASATSLIKITDATNTCVVDNSDSLFSVVPAPYIIFTGPNANITFYGKKQYSVTWYAANLTSSFVDLSLSIDSGLTWKPLANGVAKSGPYTWTAPDSVVSGNCFIKVSETGNPAVYAISQKLYVDKSQITMSTLLGGENLNGCDFKTITFTVKGTSSTYNILLSDDGGFTWKNITTNYKPFASCLSGCYTANYNWNVWRLNSTQCLVKVQDANDTLINDLSDSYFTVNSSSSPSLTMQNLNGGEILQTGSEYYFSWKRNAYAGTVYRYYSPDAGKTWNSLVGQLSTSGDSVKWIVPNVVSDSCLARIIASGNNCISDTSTSYFSIVAASNITVTYPNNSNEVIYAHALKNFTWQSANLSSPNVNLYYSLDSGATWNTMALNETNDGTYSFKVPNSLSAKCLFKVADASNSLVFDVSNAVFTIAKPSTQFTIPVAGATYLGCNAVQFAATSIGSYVSKVYFSSDSGATWIKTPITSLIYNVVWPFPNINSTKCMVMGTNDDSTVVGFSGVFTVKKPLNILGPNGSEVFDLGTTQSITWRTEAGIDPGTLTCKYSSDAGNSWFTLSTTLGNTGNYSWLVPQADSSSRMLVKISSNNNSCYNDESDDVFAVLPVPSITLTPLANIVYVGSTQYISFQNKNLASPFVNFELSLDSGATWNAIATQYSKTNFSYQWTVPNTPSTKCLIRIYEYNNPSVYAKSINVFSIVKREYISSSVANGDTINGCSLKKISWKPIGASDMAKLYFSIDGGGSWQTVAYGNTGTKWAEWKLPQVNSNNCKLKIEDYNNASIYTILDAVFTIKSSSPQLQITSPLGGEVWNTGENQVVTWTASSSIKTVSIKLFDQGGSSYTYDKVPNTGSFTFFSNYFYSNAAKVQITDENSCAVSTSPTTFIINKKPYIVFKNPIGGETFYGKSVMDMQWLAEFLQGTNDVDVSYSSNNGKTWIPLVLYKYNSYNWTVPNINSDSCRIKLIASGDQYFYAISELFSIEKPSVVITSPNGGEVLSDCSRQNITWINNGASKTVNIYYSENNGVNWNLIQNNYTYSNSPSYYWTIPNSNSINCLIKIVDANDTSVHDVSNQKFSLATNLSSSIVLSFPKNGGEVLNTGSQQKIIWTSTNDIKNVALQLSTNGGSTWTSLSYYVTNNDTLNWFVPNTPSTNCIIKIKDYAGCANDLSLPFTIQAAPFIRLDQPYGGGFAYGTGSLLNISWTQFNLNSNFVKVEYSLNAGKNWKTLTNSASGNVYSWMLVDSLITDSAVVRVSDAGNSLITSKSTTFKIVKPMIHIVYPFGGEVLSACKPIDIEWSSYGIQSNFYITYFSSNNGATWVKIDSTNFNNYTNRIGWVLPAISSTDCIIMVTDVFSNTVATSGLFTIKNQNSTLQLTSLNGGEVLNTGSTKTITWSASNNVNTVSLYFQIDGVNSSWMLIEKDVPNTGSYDWKVISNLSSSFCRIKIVDDEGCAEDVSDAFFSIQVVSFIVMNVPNGGEYFTSGDKYYIKWNSANLSSQMGYVDLFYSIDSAKTWLPIATNLVGDIGKGGMYLWTVPNVGSTKCFIKIKDSGNTATEDVSDYSFAIGSAASVVITSPTKNDVLEAAGAHNITWDKNKYSAAVLVSYSLDGGVTWIALSGYEQDTTLSTVLINDGVFEWQLPAVNSGSCLVLVQDYLENSIVHQSEMFAINAPLEIVEIDEEQLSFDVFPNPNDGFFNISMKSHAEGINISVFNLMGQNIYNENAMIDEKSTIHVSLENISSGIYLVKIQSSTNCAYKRMVIR